MAYHGPNRLYKTKDGAMIGGVCAGFSETLRMDVTLVRIIAIISSLALGSGILIYIILWALLPDKDSNYYN